MNKPLARLAVIAAATTALLFGGAAAQAETGCGDTAPVFTADESGVLEGYLGDPETSDCAYRVTREPGNAKLYLGPDGHFTLAYDRGFGRADFQYEVSRSDGKETRTAVVEEEKRAETLSASDPVAGATSGPTATTCGRDNPVLGVAGFLGAGAVVLAVGAVWQARRRGE